MTSGSSDRPPYLDLIRQRVVVFDGAMGTSIQAHALDAAGYGGIEGRNEYLVLHNPDLIAATTPPFSRSASTSSKRTRSAAAS